MSLRLQTAVELLGGCDRAADIGCDHGRVAAAILQMGLCRKVIATDISLPSLKKAERLASYLGLAERMELRQGNGFEAIGEGECEAVLILGMGGQLIARILDGCKTPLNGARRAVLQPMRGQAELRRYLHEKGLCIEEDRIVKEGRRYYQVLSITADKEPQKPMAGWPVDCYELGYISLEKRERWYKDYVCERIEQYEKQCREALGTYGEEELKKRLNDMKTILKLWEDRYETV